MKAIFQVLSFDVLSKFILGVLGIILIRYMPASEYANYTFALSLVAFVTQGVSSTFNRVYILSAKKESDYGHEWSAIGLQVFLVLLIVVLGFPLYEILGGLYWLVIVLILANCALDFAKTYYQEKFNFFRFSLIELFRSVFFFLGAGVVIFNNTATVTSAAIISVQALSLLIVAWWALSSRLSEWKPTSLRGISIYAGELAHGKYTFLFAYFFIISIFAQTDIFMLKIVGDDAMIATYGSAFRYYSILSLALGAVHAVLLPMIQNSSAHDLQIVFAKHRRFLILFAAVTAIAAWLAQWGIPLVDAGKYPEATAVFRVLCVSAVISFAFSPHVNLLMRYEHFSFLFFLALTALFLHVAINIALIPAFGAVGAAISTLVATGVITLSIYLKSRQLIKKINPLEYNNQ